MNVTTAVIDIKDIRNNILGTALNNNCKYTNMLLEEIFKHVLQVIVSDFDNIMYSDNSMFNSYKYYYSLKHSIVDTFSYYHTSLFDSDLLPEDINITISNIVHQYYKYDVLIGLIEYLKNECSKYVTNIPENTRASYSLEYEIESDTCRIDIMMIPIDKVKLVTIDLTNEYTLFKKYILLDPEYDTTPTNVYELIYTAVVKYLIFNSNKFDDISLDMVIANISIFVKVRYSIELDRVEEILYIIKDWLVYVIESITGNCRSILTNMKIDTCTLSINNEYNHIKHGNRLTNTAVVSVLEYIDIKEPDIIT
jgi:hypothetical protein